MEKLDVKPLMISVHDTELRLDRRLIAICSKLTGEWIWNATQGSLRSNHL